jgi:hypothetical protein
MIRTSMKNALFAGFYTLGLSAIWPFLIINHRSSAAWLMFLSPIATAVIAEVFARTIQITGDRAGNRIIWLIAAFVMLSQVAKFTVELDTTDGFTEYLSLNALYQILLVLIFSASKKREGRAHPLAKGQLLI